MQPLNSTGRMDDIVEIVDWSDTLDKVVKLLRGWKKINSLAPADLLKLSSANMQAIIAFKAMVPELDDTLSGGVPLGTGDGSNLGGPENQRGICRSVGGVSNGNGTVPYGVQRSPNGACGEPLSPTDFWLSTG